MKSRISITIDPVVHERAKLVAQRRGTTLSGLVESLLRQEEKSTGNSAVDRVAGTAKLRERKPGEDTLYDQLKAKYLGE